MTDVEPLYAGKAKSLYATADPTQLLMVYRDDATAGNGAKHERVPGKGQLNAAIAARLFTLLEAAHVPTHFLAQVDSTTHRVRALRMVPVEVVVRNRLAGSLARRLGHEEGRAFAAPIVEFYYKNDALGDPLVLPEHLAALGALDPATAEQLRASALVVNQVLGPRLAQVGLDLVDFKLEFGFTHQDKLVVGDEITPDTARLWDCATGDRLDKDRFRRELGDLIPAYREVLERLERDHATL